MDLFDANFYLKKQGKKLRYLIFKKQKVARFLSGIDSRLYFSTKTYRIFLRMRLLILRDINNNSS